MTEKPSFDPNTLERKRFFLSRAFLLGATAGTLETALVLSTGVMPPVEVAFNFGLLVCVFGSAAALWLLVRRSPMLHPLLGDFVLVLISTLPFAFRGCLHNCGEGWAARVAIPAGIIAMAFATMVAGRRYRQHRLLADAILIPVVAMVLTALDFTVRDGLVGSSDTLGWVAVSVVALGLFTSRLAQRGWATKLAWTLVLALASVLWASYQVRPLWIEPAAKRTVSSGSAATALPNVILVVLDTVRADHLSLYGYPRKTSPNLDALAAESLVFDHAIASGNYSLPSHASLFTGLLPSQHGAHQRFGEGELAESFRRTDSGLSSEVETLASQLGGMKFVTGGLSANYAYLAAWTGLPQGFDAFDDRPKRLLGYHPFTFPFLRRLVQHNKRPEERSEWDGDYITTAGGHFAAAAREPFFLFLNYLDAHDPYIPREGYIFRGDGIGSDVRPIPAYDSEIAYTDAALGRLVAGLRQSSLLDRTILVVTSDHGEFFGEHGFTHHKSGAYEDVLHVPLLVRYPKGLRTGRVPRPFGLHEVHRLILDLVAGHPVDWVDASADEPRVLAQVWGKVNAEDPIAGAQSLDSDANIVYQGSFKLIDRREGADEMYYLAADPNESHNLLLDPSPQTLGLKASMQAAVRKLPPPRQGTDPDASAADLAALRGLGYISVKQPGK